MFFFSLDSSNEIPGSGEQRLVSSKTTPTDGSTTASGDSKKDCISPEEWVFPRPVKATPTKGVATTTALTSGEEWIFSRLFKDSTDLKDTDNPLSTILDYPGSSDTPVSTDGGTASDSSKEGGTVAIEDEMGGATQGGSREEGPCKEPNHSGSSVQSSSTSSSGSATSGECKPLLGVKKRSANTKTGMLKASTK